MGVQFKDVVSYEKMSFKAMNGRKIAIDAFNTIYQFLAIIRRNGQPLMDSRGNVTSHLSGLMYRTSNMIEEGILPYFVFDGKPPEFKLVRKERKRRKREAQKKLDKARKEGDEKAIKKYAQQTMKLEEYMIDDSKKLLKHMGIPWIQAPSEGEAQAAYMASKGDAWAVGSQDFDSLLFGAPRLVRNLTTTGRRKVPRKNTYITISPEKLELKKITGELGLERRELVCMALLIGTDYNPGGIKGVGPKTALKLVKEKGCDAVDDFDWEDEWPDPESVVDFFMDPPHTDSYSLEWQEPDEEAIMNMLVDRHDFSESRVKKVVDRLESQRKKGQQGHLSQWF